ncbi:MAG: hypothetical protein ACF8PG_14985 [Maioricimonas sp. JB045]
MLKALIMRALNHQEKYLGASLDYIRHIVRTSTRAFFTFKKVIPFTRYRDVLPADVWHAARLVAVQHEDCGTCVQVEVNLSRKDGLSPALIRTILDRRTDDLAEPLQDVVAFAGAVAAAREPDPSVRQRIEDRYGDRGLVELAYAITAARIFPTVKRSLGYAKSCELVEVEV